MTKETLSVEIEAYGAARATNNSTLVIRQSQILQALLNKLPDQLAEKDQPVVTVEPPKSP